MFFLTRKVDVERFNTYGIYSLGSLLREAHLCARQPLGLWAHIAVECRGYLLDALSLESSFRLTISVEQARHMASQLGHVVSLRQKHGADHELPEDDLRIFNSAYFAFIGALILDLGQAPTFFVTQKGVYNTDSLINNGSSVYADLLEHLPQEAIEDTDQAARCLAFTLPTASGFHTARATEAVAKKYLLHLGCTEDDIKKTSNWGGYHKLMKDKKGDDAIAHHFDQLRSLHRNPLIHPEVTLGMTEAQSFWAMCTSLIISMVTKMNPSGPSEPSGSPDPGEANV